MTPPREMLGHPQGLFYLFFAELWERFSFYGMRALLTLYMVQQVFERFSGKDVIAATIFASYGSLVYASPVLGGYISDKLLGYRRSILLGGVLMAIGHFVMAIEHNYAFYLALGFLVMGNGFFKPNISTFVGALYAEGDTRKESGFTIYYMGINLGGALAPLLCGYLGQTFGWHYGFGLAGIGMLVGLFFFTRGIQNGAFYNKGKPPVPKYLEKKYVGLPLRTLIPMLSFLVVPVIAWMIASYEAIGKGQTFLGNTTPVSLVFSLLGVFMVLYMIYILVKANATERFQLLAALFLIFCMTIFWGFFELQGSSLTLFAERNVNLVWFNASQTNSINALFIIGLAVPMSMLWGFLSKQRLNPRSPYKFAFGLFWASIAFYILYLSKFYADETGKVPFFFLLFAYFLISTGELFMSPVGLSKMTDLAPKRMIAFIMGVWLLSSAYAFQIVGFIGRLLAIESDTEQGIVGTESLEIYTHGFEQIAYFALATAVLALIVSPIITRWMRKVH